MKYEPCAEATGQNATMQKSHSSDFQKDTVHLSERSCSIKNMRFSRFEQAFVHCESGALSTDPMPRGTLSLVVLSQCWE